MKIALIGATGFVGSRVLAEALSRNHEVTAIASVIPTPVGAQLPLPRERPSGTRSIGQSLLANTPLHTERFGRARGGRAERRLSTYVTNPRTSARSVPGSQGFSIRAFGTFFKNSRAAGVKAPPVSRTIRSACSEATALISA
jgi:hypothetical protein